MEEGRKSECPDWAHLPSVAVQLISEKMKSIADYVRFRAVCSPWRSGSLAKPHHLVPQLPWLMLPYAPKPECTDDDGVRLFYDLWESKMHKLYLPETIGKSCCATYRGWLLIVAARGSELFLLNPLTRARVDLPSFTTPVTHIWAEEGDSPYEVGYLFKYKMGNFAITKVTFSSDLTDRNCIIMVFFQRSQGIFFCRIGDLLWTEVAMPPVPIIHPADAAYHNGSFHFVRDGAIFSYDLNQHKVQGVYFFEPELLGVDKYFLVGKSGLYLVAMHFIEEEGQAEDASIWKEPKQRLDMYRITEELMGLQRITDTSDTTIFYGDNCHYLAVRAGDWDSLDGGCMYMKNLWVPTDFDNNEPRTCYNIQRAKLDDGMPQLLLFDIGKKLGKWSHSPVMWFQPSDV